VSRRVDSGAQRRQGERQAVRRIPSTLRIRGLYARERAVMFIASVTALLLHATREVSAMSSLFVCKRGSAV